MRRTVLLALVALTMSLTIPATAQTDDGEEIYRQACASCHQPGGAGIVGTFPPLAGNPNAADVDYVTSVITDGLRGPLTVEGVAYDGEMPPVTTLSEDQIAAVAAFVATLAGREPTTTTTLAPVTDGDRSEGERLFTGATRFINGAPACASCHSAGSHALLGGPGLGPDLTGFFVRFAGEAGVAAALANPPSATMAPLFDDRPLSNQEIADLAAYFEVVAEEPGPGGPDLLTIFGLAGAAGLFGFLALFVRKPRGTYLDNKRGGAR